MVSPCPLARSIMRCDCATCRNFKPDTGQDLDIGDVVRGLKAGKEYTRPGFPVDWSVMLVEDMLRFITPKGLSEVPYTMTTGDIMATDWKEVINTPEKQRNKQ